MLKLVAILIVLTGLAGVFAKPLIELRLGSTVIDTDHVDCKSAWSVIDECGLQQGYSYKYTEFSYPTNHSQLMSSCRRNSDAFKCLKAYAKCLPPLSKQVLIALVNSRQKYNKKICTDKPSEAANKLMDLGRCMLGNKELTEKGIQAELNSIALPEAIAKAKVESASERLKYSCCSVAEARQEYYETTLPYCKQHAQTAIELEDSFLADTVGIICPNFDDKQRKDCDRLPKLPLSKAQVRNFIGPTMRVIQALA